MSYIVPVTDFQSVHYAARTVGELEGSRSFIRGTKPIFSVELHRKKEEEHQQKDVYSDMKAEEDDNSVSILNRSKRNNHVPLEVLQRAAAITGKGKFVNKYI